MRWTLARRAFLRPGFYVAAAIAAIFVAPTLAWQYAHGWPQFEVLRHAAMEKNVVVGPAAFFLQQVLMMNPLAAPLWIAGLVSLLASPETSRLRWYEEVTLLILSALYLVLGAKVYYLAPIYPVLIAAGGVPVERFVQNLRWARIAYPVALFVSGALIAPLAFPLLPMQQFLAYQSLFDVRSIKMEKHPVGRVPQHFADMLGWGTLVRSMAQAYDSLPPDEQRQTAILPPGTTVRLPHPLLRIRLSSPASDQSGHNQFYIYGPRGASAKSCWRSASAGAALAEFRSVERVGTSTTTTCFPIRVRCRSTSAPVRLESMADWWPSSAATFDERLAGRRVILQRAAEVEPCRALAEIVAGGAKRTRLRAARAGPRREAKSRGRGLPR